MGNIFISGKISGVDDYMERFAAGEQTLCDMGFSGLIVNPAKVGIEMPKSTTYEEFMKLSLCLLATCDTIFMLKGWEDSPGANLEFQYAKTCGYKIMYQSHEEG